MELKPGIKLPKAETGWKEADMYFRSVLHAGDVVTTIFLLKM